MDMDAASRSRAIYRVTLAGSLVNLLLVLFKFAAGIVGHSAAMVADAVHSLSDFATDIVVMLFVRISSKPQDKGHDYGHGKYETLATAFIGILLLGVGVSICWNGVADIVRALNGQTLPQPGMLALWAAILSIVSKEVAYHYTVAVGRRVNSQAVIANAWHHRSDAFSSVGTAAGIGGAILLGDRWSVLDPIAAVVVSLFILRVALSLLKPCMEELTEKSLPDEVEEEIAEIVRSQPDVSGLHNLRTRRIGNHYAIEMHIRMDGSLPLFEAHCKASFIERRLKERFGADTHVGIHVEPTKQNGMYADRCNGCVCAGKSNENPMT